MSRRALLLGGGISGLAAGQQCLAMGHEPVILNAAPSPGGLTRSVQIGEYAFDYTGHLLHLARCERPSEVPHAHLVDGEWQRINRRSYCLIEGALVPAPVQYNFSALPDPARERCVASYESRPPLAKGESSFRDFVVSGFGEELAELFLIPQNEKTQAIPLRELSMKAVRRFFPAPDEAKVRAGMEKGHQPPAEYNSQFWYPRIGGIERLVKGLAAGLEGCMRPLSVVESVDLAGQSVTLTNGETHDWDVAISSLPLRALCRLSNSQELRALAMDLTHSSTVVFNLGLQGDLPEELRDAQWIYVPDRSIPFYRVGFYSNISGGMCPPGHHALYVEVGMPPEKARDVNLIERLQPQVLLALQALGWVKPGQVKVCAANVMDCAYVHHTPRRDAAVEAITRRLGQCNLHPCGRYGLWDYISMEDSIHSGIDTAKAALA